MVREFRSLKARELRAEQGDDGKQYLAGYAANFNVLSEELWPGMQERIMPGCFARALREGQDVRHLMNHDPNLVLGRTKAKTTELAEDAQGLKFRTLLPDTTYARDLYASVQRGDIDECSFGFVAVRTVWIDEPDPDDAKRVRSIRELHDVDLFDVSTVTYPAYPGTKTTAEMERTLFPDGVPAEVRSRMTRDAGAGDACSCGCMACMDGDCDECSDENCADAACKSAGCPMQERSLREKKKKTKKVDGEDLTSDCFLIVGDTEDTSTWKLPWKFSTDEKTKAHLQNALVRFNQLKGVSEEDAKKAWTALVRLCKEHGVDVEADEQKSLRSRLTADQVNDLCSDVIATARMRLHQQKEIEASL